MDVGEQLERYARRKKRLGIVFSVIALLAAAVVTMYMLTYISSYRVEGNAHISEEEITGRLFPGQKEQRFFYAWLRNLAGRNPKIDGLKKYTLTFLPGFAVRVDVTEKAPLGAVPDGKSYRIFDDSAYVLYTGGTLPDGTVLVRGLDCGREDEPRFIHFTDAKTEDILRLLKLLDAHGIAVEAVDYDEDLTVSVRVGETKVLLGTNRQMDEKIADLADILNSRRLDNLAGILHLEEYDESSSYIFEQTE